jgi:hypothetical protein
MLDRRRFTFGALLVAAAGPAVARAEEPVAPRLGARWEAGQRRDVLEVKLTLQNLGPDALPYVAKYGSRLGPWLQARRVGAPEGEELAAITVVDRRELVSRMGPRPEWATLAAAGSAGDTVEVGVYRFAAPEGPLGEVEVQGNVEIQPGPAIQLPWTRIAVPTGRVGA